MKFNFEKTEKIFSNITLYFFIFFVLCYEKIIILDLFNNYAFYSQKIALFGPVPTQIFIFLNIAMFLVAIGVLILNNDCDKKITPWSKIAFIIIFFKIVRYLNPLFNLSLTPYYRELIYYNSDFIINIIKLLIMAILIPCFFNDKYRKFFYASKTDIFILIVGLTSFLDIFIHAFNFYFVLLFADILTVLIIFAVLLPYSDLSLRLQGKYKIDEVIKFKLAIFLYFFGKGLIVLQYAFEPIYIIIYPIMITAIALSLSKWFIGNLPRHDSSMLKKLYSITFILIAIGWVCKINNSFEQSQKYQLGYYKTLANLTTIKIIDYENEIEIPTDVNDDIKLSSQKLQQKLEYFIKHVSFANNSFADLVNNPDEKLNTQFYDYYEDYNRAYIYLFDAYNDLLKFDKTKKPEFALDYKNHINDYRLLYNRINPRIKDIYNSLNKEKQNSSLFEPMVKNLSSTLIR